MIQNWPILNCIMLAFNEIISRRCNRLTYSLCWILARVYRGTSFHKCRGTWVRHRLGNTNVDYMLEQHWLIRGQTMWLSKVRCFPTYSNFEKNIKWDSACQSLVQSMLFSYNNVMWIYRFYYIGCNAIPWFFFNQNDKR